jgi:hypothetical protein
MTPEGCRRLAPHTTAYRRLIIFLFFEKAGEACPHDKAGRRGARQPCASSKLGRNRPARLEICPEEIVQFPGEAVIKTAEAMPGVILDETKKLARTPGRWRELFRPRRWRQFFSILFFNARAGDWKSVPGAEEFQRRQYASYDEYVRHQQSKLQYLDLAEYDRTYRQQLRERLQKLSALKKGASVLCLGARQGTEVAAFHDLGCFAVGVDLNPGANNPLVLYGDFHNLPFSAQSVDVVFTNSLDHAFDLEKLIAEITRVLKPGGVLIIEAIRGGEEKSAPDHYASLWWKRTEDLAAVFERHCFKPVQREAFDQPWPGMLMCFVLES